MKILRIYGCYKRHCYNLTLIPHTDYTLKGNKDDYSGTLPLPALPVLKGAQRYYYQPCAWTTPAWRPEGHLEPRCEANNGDHNWAMRKLNGANWQ
ncbi:hypothetical protein E2C01_015538 [Portunus trituberculatus]|uniref:Uncharacterized protein n=1 Tax=Portunus trituberculatus TaxID=210409 RepID=A0A5B7DLT3_PORTR|nr:hypothetical protein [Portunus trituberculatus]